MSQIDVNQVLAQMRVMAAQSSGQTEQTGSTAQTDFSNVLKQSINAVNDNQQAAMQLSTEFQLGENDVSLSEVMISAQKASVSFQAMVQVRNKLVEAYKDVMNMPM
ncbi:MAG: flagellar hook-basal body complex protein FliE [Gammaproteobacteria bacterium]|nr:MAG: flagellar hook-basal body complex protein FliE [Gammaproteobacteria bacterium]